MMSENQPQAGSGVHIREHRIELRVRYAEVDRMGLLHHSRYAIYFEIGRTELLRVNGYEYRDLEQQGIFLVVARLSCQFRSPAYYDDVLALETRISELDTVRIHHGYRLTRPTDTRLIAEGETVLVHVDRQGRLQRLPELFRGGQD